MCPKYTGETYVQMISQGLHWKMISWCVAIGMISHDLPWYIQPNQSRISYMKFTTESLKEYDPCTLISSFPSQVRCKNLYFKANIWGVINQRSCSYLFIVLQLFWFQRWIYSYLQAETYKRTTSADAIHPRCHWRWPVGSFDSGTRNQQGPTTLCGHWLLSWTKRQLLAIASRK